MAARNFSWTRVRAERRAGFTLVELLVVIAIIAVLAGLSLPAINNALKKARQTADVSNAKNIGLALSSFAADNGGAYPDEGTSTEAFRKLGEGGYLSSAAILATAPQKAGSFNALTESNVSWSMTMGVTEQDSDLLPLLFSRGNAVAHPAAELTEPADLVLNPTGDGPWKADGIAVFYKSNQAKFIRGVDRGGSKAATGFWEAGFPGSALPVRDP